MEIETKHTANGIFEKTLHDNGVTIFAKVEFEGKTKKILVERYSDGEVLNLTVGDMLNGKCMDKILQTEADVDAYMYEKLTNFS